MLGQPSIETKLKVLSVVHSVLVGYITLGWVIGGSYLGGILLFIHIYACLALLYHWLSNNQECALTQLEKKWIINNHSDTDTDTKDGFVGGILNRVGVNVSDNALILITNLIVILACVISVGRLIVLYPNGLTAGTNPIFDYAQ